jgi:hypothetical protein
MDTQIVKIDRDEAQRLYREYKKHQHYSTPIDQEVQRAYKLIAQGKVVIQAIESIRLSGLDDKGLPKLALAPATAETCHLRRYRNGSMIMSPEGKGFSWRQERNRYKFADETFEFPVETFKMVDWGAGPRRENSSEHRATMPIIPIHLRPKRALANYHVLWEAEWQPLPPKDPYLLRRIGRADLWLVVAAWDLTEVERAAMATRIVR